MQQRIHLICRGRVQGVFFRATAQDEARHLGLVGWVRNSPDGTVEIMAEGDLEALRDFQAWCAHGPPHARVTAVEVQSTAATGEFDGFTVRY